MKRGHYTCWVNESRTAGTEAEPEAQAWRLYDDDRVGEPQSALPASVTTSAYLVFYEQKVFAPDSGAVEVIAAEEDEESATEPDVCVAEPTTATGSFRCPNGTPRRPGSQELEPNPGDLHDPANPNASMHETGSVAPQCDEGGDVVMMDA